MIEAQELLLQLRVADYPNANKEIRTKTHREWFKLAYPKTVSGPELNTEQAAEKLRMLING